MRRFLAPVLLLAGLGLAQETGYNTTWAGHRSLLLNTSSLTGTAISANVVKYPLLVRLTAADSAVFAASKANGADIRFTKANNTTRLKHQIDRWDSAGRKAEIWVLIDTVYANNSSQSFRMHWGNAAAADSSNGTAVFDTTDGYLGVWHMGDSTGNKPRPNSVAGGKPATPAANSAGLLSGFVPVNGAIGKADTLRSANNNQTNDDHFSLDTGYVFPTGQVTMSMWIWLPSAFPSTAYFHFLNFGNTNLNNNLWFGRIGNTNDFSSRSANNTMEGTGRTVANGLLPLASWNHFGVTTQGTNGRNRTLYRNGVIIGNYVASGAATDTVDDILPVVRKNNFIGRSLWPDRNMRGNVDEVRVSKVSRSPDWFKLDYASQAPNAAFVTQATLPTLAYTADSVSVEASFGIAPIKPATLTGTPAPTLSISPAIGNGLTFTAATGTISGTPTAAATKTKYIITATNSAGSVTDSIWITVTAPTVTEDYTTWTGTKTVAFTSAAAVSRFPLLVRLGASDSAIFTAGRNSLRFSRTDGTKLRYEIDAWDSAGRSAAVWVLMDNVAAGANSVRLHWGKTGATNQSNANGVFEASNGYVGVWHLGNAAGIDPRPNAVAGAPAATPSSDSATTQFGGGASVYVAPTGVIGKADTLRALVSGATGASTRNAPRVGADYLNLGNAPGATTSPFTGANTYPGYSNFSTGFTYSLWVKPGTPIAANTYMMALSNAASSAKDNMQFFRTSATSGAVKYEDINGTSTTNGGPTTGSILVNETWQRMVVTFDASRKLSLSRNGVELFSNYQQNGTIRDTIRVDAWIGKSPYNDPYFRGAVDDPRISNVARSSEWNTLEYETQAPGVMPVAISYSGVAANYPPLTAITPITPAVSGTGAKFSVSPALPAGLSIDSLTGVISGNPSGAVSTKTYTVTAVNGPWSSTATLSFSTVSGDGPYATAWSQHRYVTLNATATGGAIGTTLLKFPVLVRLGAADSAIFNASQDNGADIRFTKLNDITRLPHEIEQWDKANKKAVIWVLMDTVKARTTASRMRLHWGNATVADSSKPSAVFDSTNYVAVFHMGGPNNTAARPNAVPGGNPATPSNLPSAYVSPAGMIGMADSLGVAGTGGNGAYFSFGPIPVGSVPNGKVTYSLWIKRATFASSWRHIMSIGSGAPNNNFWFGTTADEADAIRIRTAEGTTEMTAVNVSGGWLTNQWQLVTVSFDGPATTVYSNGVLVGEGDIGHTLGNVARTSAYLGRSLWSADNKFLGVYDEARVAKLARNTQWAKLEYDNQKAAQDVISFTTALVGETTAINGTSASILGGQSLGVKALGRGLLFQVQGDVNNKVRIAIVDMHGRQIWSRTAATSAGLNEITWDGRSKQGQGIGSGIYVVRMNLLDAEGKATQSLVRKIPLTR